MNELLFDGANNSAPERQEIAVSPSVDAVAEFKVIPTCSGGVRTDHRRGDLKHDDQERNQSVARHAR